MRQQRARRSPRSRCRCQRPRSRRRAQQCLRRWLRSPRMRCRTRPLRLLGRGRRRDGRRVVRRRGWRAGRRRCSAHANAYYGLHALRAFPLVPAPGGCNCAGATVCLRAEGSEVVLPKTTPRSRTPATAGVLMPLAPDDSAWGSRGVAPAVIVEFVSVEEEPSARPSPVRFMTPRRWSRYTEDLPILRCAAACLARAIALSLGKELDVHGRRNGVQYIRARQRRGSLPLSQVDGEPVNDPLRQLSQVEMRRTLDPAVLLSAPVSGGRRDDVAACGANVDALHKRMVLDAIGGPG